MGLFTYPRAYSSTREERQSVITRERAEYLADHLSAEDLYHYSFGYTGPFQKAGIDAWGDLGWELVLGDAELSARLSPKLRCFEFCPHMHRYLASAELFALVDGSPQGWQWDVLQVLHERASEVARKRHEAAIEAIDTTPAIRAHLRRTMGDRNARIPERRPFNGRPVRPGFTPDPTCTARLRCSEAVHFYTEQASYADHSRCLIPVDGTITDEARCRSNLAKWCEAMRTHNGFAGSGCTYTTTLHVTPEGAYVELDCRASISD